MSFQTTVLWVAVFIFFAVLAFIGYNIYSSKYNTVSWPPFVSDLCSGTTSFSIKDYPNLCDKFDFTTKKRCGAQFNWSGVSNSLTCM